MNFWLLMALAAAKQQATHTRRINISFIYLFTPLDE
jgi:hypothetical protein